MKDDSLDHLRDLALRRELSPEERARLAELLARDPVATDDTELDLALGHALRRLPQVPVASNFTSRVMAEIARDEQAAARGRGRWSLGGHWRRWIPVGTAVLVAAGGLVSWRWHEQRSNANDLREIAALRALSNISPSVLQDFDAIQRFGEGSAPVDYELLAALQ